MGFRKTNTLKKLQKLNYCNLKAKHALKKLEI